MSKYLLTLVIVAAGSFSQAYTQPTNGKQSFAFWQDSLKVLSSQMSSRSIAEPERYNANYAFIKTLVHALKIPQSFKFGFDSLKTISITHSGDAKFRFFTWNIANNDGTYRYYGTIQMNSSDGKLKLFPLVDYTPSISKPSDTITTNDQWYGAQYYQIIPVTQNTADPYYILLGWKGNTNKSTKKVIEILSFKDGKAYFGRSVFDGAADFINKKRVIFEYNSKVSMMLRHLADKNMIVFDHLSPMNAHAANKPELYGPDMSYDGFRLINGRCQFVSNLMLKNAPSEKDDQYIDPAKKDKRY